MRNFSQNQKNNHPVLTTCQNHLSCDSHNFLLINPKFVFLDFLDNSQSEIQSIKMSHNFKLPIERKLVCTIEMSLISEI
jgi:hypothetical protein